MATRRQEDIVTVEQDLGSVGGQAVLRAERRLRERSDELLADLEMHVAMATDLDLPLAAREQTRDALAEFCTRRMVTHLLAVDQTLYSIAAASVETRLLASALRAQHDLIAARVAELLRADSSAEVAASAHAVLGLMQVCHYTEQRVLLPALAHLSGVDLVALVNDIEALLAGESLETPAEIDVREIPLTRRYPQVFAASARLAAGQAFVLVGSHDPQRLREELQSAYPGRFGWDYLEAGPERWRVRIARRPEGV